MSEPKFYICEHCGNIVGKIHDAGVPLMCCGQKMKELVPGTVEASTEKHIPVANLEGNVVKVTGTEVNVITVKGVSDGTAKLTVKCGSYSKTISVTVGTGTGGGSGSSTPSDPTPEDKPGSDFSDFIERILGFFCSVVPHDIFI